MSDLKVSLIAVLAKKTEYFPRSFFKKWHERKRRTIQQKPSDLLSEDEKEIPCRSLSRSMNNNHKKCGEFFWSARHSFFLGLSEQLWNFGALFADTLSLFGKNIRHANCFWFLSSVIFLRQKMGNEFYPPGGILIFLIGGLGIVHTLTLSTKIVLPPCVSVADFLAHRAVLPQLFF